MSKNRVYNSTLGFVNRVNIALGRRPLARLPKGSDDPFTCPIAKALRGRLDAEVEVSCSILVYSEPLAKAVAHALRQPIPSPTPASWTDSSTVWEFHRVPKYITEFVALHDDHNAFELQTYAA